MPASERPNKKATEIVRRILGKPSNYDADPKKNARLRKETEMQDTRYVRGA